MRNTRFWLEVAMHAAQTYGAKARRFFFMYYGKKLCVEHFLGQFSIAEFQGTMDSSGCYFIYMKLSNNTQLRPSQVVDAITDFNQHVDGDSAMRLVSLPYEPSIVTMRTRRLTGCIFNTIQIDKKLKVHGFPSNYWEYKVSSSSVSEFDVVKKRKAMEAAPAEEESAPEALAMFEEFEASVLSALERIGEDEDDFRRLELVEMEESFSKGEAMSSTGGVYFAWSPCLKCMKIGATRKEDPQVRLRQLSRYVTEPFTLSAWLPTATPFRLEAAAHLHFKPQRINSRGSGAGTEFFRIGAAAAAEYVGGMY
jgi:hypothetical protein